MVSKNRLKFIKSLKIKKYRQQESCFLIEGRKNVLELINSDFEILDILGTGKFLSAYANELAKLPEDLISEVKSEVLSDVGSFQTNMDCLAVARMKPYDISTLEIMGPTFVLDGVGDPGNLGTIIRTLDWFGVRTLICSPDTTEFYSPKVINATMGSFTRMNVYHTSLSDLFRKHGLPVYGADLGGIHPRKAKISGPCFVLMGSESHGIRPEIQPYITQSITIPGRGGAESLNVAMATGILAYELFDK